MKVSEILEILTENGVQCSKENLFDELDNIGYENVSLDTDIDINDVKKLSKRYKTDIKPKKVKKEPKKVEPKKTEVKKVEEKKTEVKKVEPKKEKPASNSVVDKDSVYLIL